MFTIDSLGLDACDFIQLDIEGFELPVQQHQPEGFIS
jgi:hypothetical protein